MKMIVRWFGEGHDSVPLAHIRQIPGVSGVAATLMDKQAGELWSADEVDVLRAQIARAGLEMDVIESVNIHDDIKLGAPERETYIGRYIDTVRNLGRTGVKVICYNFMPIFDWMRTDLSEALPDGSRTMSYRHALMRGVSDPDEMIRLFEKGSGGFALPGWEKERLGDVRRLFGRYEGITADDLFDNLGYFLSRILPVCEEYGVKMAIHPDDPPWSLFGLPRVLKDRASMQRVLALADSACNCVTLCTGSLGVDADNDLVGLIGEFGSRIPFAHVRNFKRCGPRDFYECAHLSEAGALDMVAIVRALHDHAPGCYVRPDHGRMIWGENARPGYGLYDRALGATYLTGIFETVEKLAQR